MSTARTVRGSSVPHEAMTPCPSSQSLLLDTAELSIENDFDFSLVSTPI